MNIEGTNYQITKSRNGEIWYEFGRGWKQIFDDDAKEYAETLLQMTRGLRRGNTSGANPMPQILDLKSKIESYEVHVDGEEIVVSKEELVNRIMQFFSEFKFEPNFRFINTFAYACLNGTCTDYVTSYFELSDSPYTSSVIEKMKSPEFKETVSDVSRYGIPTKKINHRFKIFYGSQGTGKTTLAMKEADDCVVCHSAMLPSDLMEDFSFDDGKAGFNPSVLYRAMEEGKVVVLDEINLLPFESLRFLQGILDGKSEITYKGRKIKIHDDFAIIGTMNLVVNGCTFGLPEPLIDRASELKCFKLTAMNLVGALD